MCAGAPVFFLDAGEGKEKDWGSGEFCRVNAYGRRVEILAMFATTYQKKVPENVDR